MQRREASEGRRVAIGLAAGVVSATAAASFCPWQLDLLVGWNIGSAILLGLVWASVRHLDPSETRALAADEDNTVHTFRAIVVLAATASLGSVVFGVIKAHELDGPLSVVVQMAAVLTVVTAWLTVHTMFMLRYAHQFVRDGGIDFGHTDDPTYRDFAYVSFTVGMTFQVSDTDITRSAMRRLILSHALLSYLFGTVILGLTINVMAGLLG